MPFVLRVVEPKYLSRTSLHDADGVPKVKEDELLAVTNCTLSSALKQLASLVLLANDIFSDLANQLNDVGDRSRIVQEKISRIGLRVEEFDPKKVTVPEGDLTAFALRKEHYTCKSLLNSDLFTPDTRPKCLVDLYSSAGRLSPQPDGSTGPRAGRRSPLILCTPVLGARRRKLREKVDVEIETRLPAAIEELRKWTSSEALGDLTVLPDGRMRITTNLTLEDTVDSCGGLSSGDDEPLDHKLPSPEEQLGAIALKFPPEMVPIDTSGRGFDRMCISRRSLLHVDTSCDRNVNGIDTQTVKRRTRSRKPRGKRRNTITGTDQKEIRDAIAGDETSPVDDPGSPDSGAATRSRSGDLLKTSSHKKSHFDSLKQWGRSRLRMMSRSPGGGSRDPSKGERSESGRSPAVRDVDDVNAYETVTMRRKKTAGKQQDRKISHERNNSYSSSEKSAGIAVASGALSLAVRLREASAGGRRRRARDEPHSSSGNWSASSESGRTSVGSEITSTTAAPRSTTSAATSSNSLNVGHGPPSSIVSRRRFLNTSGSGSVTSEGTLTPDIIHDLHDDTETGSEFSCDTEGYYTSFHVDSGLKTLKEEEISLPITPLHTTSTFTGSANQTAENEYELFGKGSTSTTTSSAGTVCTTLLAAGSDRSLVLGPAVPERKSSLTKLNRSRSSSSGSAVNPDRSLSNGTAGSNSDRMGTIIRNGMSKNTRSGPPASTDSLLNRSLNDNPSVLVRDEKVTSETVTADVHRTGLNLLPSGTGAESPDSGHNTSSSPVDDSVSSANGGKLSYSELDFSESSDLEGVDRIERIRVKTTINSSRIPSMCVITPHNSDDESVKSSKRTSSDKTDGTTRTGSSSALDECDRFKDKIGSRPKLDLPPQETDLDTLVFNDAHKSVSMRNIQIIDKPIDAFQADGIFGLKSKTKKPISTKQSDTRKPSTVRSYRMPLNNLMCRLKEAFPQKLSLKKSPGPKDDRPNESPYGDNGEYVTIADVRNNNQKVNINSGGGVYYSNDTVKRNLQTVLSGRLQETEYVSLNELPANISAETMSSLNDSTDEKLERAHDILKKNGARVTLDSAGKVIYSSDSLKRRKGAHTTFEPGPFVKDVPDIDADDPADSESLQSMTLLRSSNLSDNATIVPKILSRLSSPTRNILQDKQQFSVPMDSNRPLSPQLGKVVIRAPGVKSNVAVPTSEVVRMPPSSIVTPNTGLRPMSPRSVAKGAYVNIQDAHGVSLSPIKDNDQDYRHSSADRLQQGISSHLANPPLQPDTYNASQSSSMPKRTAQGDQNFTEYSRSPQKVGPDYWTLQHRKPASHIFTDDSASQRSVTPNIQRDLRPFPADNLSTFRNPHDGEYQRLVSPNIHSLGTPVQIPKIVSAANVSFQRASDNSFVPINSYRDQGRLLRGYNSDLLKMSPIDPRNAGGFQSSTPTREDTAKENSINATNQMTSPLKSTMSNEELYAVIHKSKKKMNIKSPPLDRAGSPALSVSSLSPGSSESSIPGRITPVKMPETGYLTDARGRHSWSPNNQDNFASTAFNRNPETSSPRQHEMGPRQSWACADRLGPAPQTSRLDFKKLLLQHGVKLNLQYTQKQPAKVSAVERLKLSKESPIPGQSRINNLSNVNILDLSGSPKTYTHRRMMRIGNNPNPSSPSRTNTLIKEHKVTPKILLSPKTQWRFPSPRSDVLSSPIPEAFNEDDSPNGSGDRDQREILTDFSNKTTAKSSPKTAEPKPGQGFRRSLIPTIRENVLSDNSVPRTEDLDNGISPIKDNLFLKTQENNFTKSELQALNTFGQPQKLGNSQGKLTRAEYIQAQKAQFLSQDAPVPNIPSQIKSTPRHGPKNVAPISEPVKSPSPPTLETAL